MYDILLLFLLLYCISLYDGRDENTNYSTCRRYQNNIAFDTKDVLKNIYIHIHTIGSTMLYTIYLIYNNNIINCLA